MLHLRLLGQFDVRSDGQRIVLPTRASQSLLAYLVLNAGAPQRREKLAGLFWGETSDELARRYLRNELWRIRKAIVRQPSPADEFLLSDEFTIAFNAAAPYWLDVTALEKASADIESLSSGLALYRGELLPGFYDDWIILERERLQGVFENQAGLLLDQLIQAQRWNKVSEWAERWIALGQTPEPAYRALMIAAAAQGDSAKLTLVYERCLEAMRNDLGLDPSAETRTLYKQLSQETRVTVRAGSFQLPAVQTSGTVTFLFTDIEGSTKLLEALGNDYAMLLAEQRDLLRLAAENWNGHEVDTQGDAFFFAFFRAADAIAFSAEAQRALATHAFPRGATVRVRMGIHTGEPMLARTGYVGMDVHRAARIAAAGYGGQVLVSQSTRELVQNELAPDVALRDLGEHKLKDLRYPIRIFQLNIEGLPAEFPPLKSGDSKSDPPAPGEPPFKGLEFFGESDAALFFGREALTEKLIRQLNDSQFLAVVIGASGSGKSSAVRAGLVPALRQQSPDGRIFVMTPTEHPLEALAVTLTREHESVTTTATLMDDLANDPRSLYLYLRRALNNLSLRVLLVVDQFEELFTLCTDDFERQAFIDNLVYALAQSASQSLHSQLFSLVLTLRADFYSHLAGYPELRDAVSTHQEYIGPMNSEELRRAIEEPAKAGGWELEPGLVDLMLRDVGDEPGTLPLLSHALLETWKRRSGHTLTVKGYQDAGGVRGAIAQTADAVYQSLSGDNQTIARNIFLRLTRLGEGTEDTRRRATMNELILRPEDADRVRAVVNQLADARLITTSEHGVEVAHEALIREWGMLRGWLDGDREGLRVHRHLTDASHEWELVERDTGALYRGAHLAQARDWAAANPDALNDQERAFLAASIAEEQREIEDKELQQTRHLKAAQALAETQSRAAKQLRRRAIFLAGALVVALVLAGLALFLNNQSRASAMAAENNARAATARELAVSAINNMDIDPERSILLAMRAVTTTYAIDGTTTEEAVQALHRALQNSRLRVTVNTETANPVFAMAPDGKQLAIGGEDGHIQLLDFARGKELFAIAAHEHTVSGLTFSPDGTRLASAADDGMLKVWDLATRQALLTWNARQGPVFQIAYSHDGKRLATGAENNTAIIWDAATGSEMLTLVGHKGQVVWLDFSPDDMRLATASDDNTVKVWDAVTGKELFTLSDFASFVSSVRFSPDGTQLATSGDQNGPILWDAVSGKQLINFPEVRAAANGLEFSADGKYLAAGSQDGTAYVWDTATGQEFLRLAGSSPISYIALSQGCTTPPAPFEWCGVYLATSARDKTVKVWDISPAGSRELLTVPGLWHFASPDGKQLVTSTVDASARLRNRVWQLPSSADLTVNPADPLANIEAQSGQELSSYTLGESEAPVVVAMTTDHKRFAFVNSGGFAALNADYSDPDSEKFALVAGIVDIPNGQEILKFPLTSHTAPLWFNGLALSPDGTRLATGSLDHTARVWDLTNEGKELLSLTGHQDGIIAIAYSPDGTKLATASKDRTAKVWDAVTGKELFTFRHDDWVSNVVFSPDGSRLATSSFDVTARVWDLTTGNRVLTLTGHPTTVWGLAYSADGNQIATGSSDGTTNVWDATTGEQLLRLQVPAGVQQLSFTPDGIHLVTTSIVDQTVRAYLLQVQDLMALARSRVSRALTTQECQQYLHMETCPVE